MDQLRRKSARVGLLLLCQIFSFSAVARADDLQTWLTQQLSQSQTLMLEDVSRPGAAAGSVVAAPGATPDYYYHWIRDSGLVMDVVFSLYQKATSDSDRSRYLQTLSDFIQFSEKLQATANRSGDAYGMGLGEPKFNVDGSVFEADWGRPQNDGPAIRATAMIHLAQTLLDQGQFSWVSQNLYQSDISAHSLIKTDLEFVSNHWQDPSYDLWEEVEGTHFYTRMVQRRALLEGAELANRLNDPGAAAYYQAQAQQIEQQLSSHWDSNRGYLVETINQTGGLNGKTSGLDVAVVLGSLHGAVTYHSTPIDQDTQQFSYLDDRVIATALKIAQAFQSLFPINSNSSITLAPGIGRYPEDHYNGYVTTSLGNPWFLATNAFAELHYRYASAIQAQGSFTPSSTIVQWVSQLSSGSVQLVAGQTYSSSDALFSQSLAAIRAGGDAYLARTKLHSDSTGELSEEMDRNTGFMTGAQNLTWSHASLLTAAWARAQQ